jgi:hypothetical protein
MDWKAIVGNVAPGLATAFGGPLAGAAVGMLAKSILGETSGDKAKDEAALAEALSGGMTPELRAKVIETEASLKIEAMRMGLEEKKVEQQTEIAYLGDVADARKAHGGDKDIMWMGACVLIAWAVLTAGTLAGLYSLLHGGIEIKDVGVVATVFTVLGSVVGYVSNAAQQVLSYFYGSSRGSDRKTMAMSEAISSVKK